MKRFLFKAFVFMAPPVVLGVAWTAFVVFMDYRSYRTLLVAPPGAEVAVCGDSQTKDALDPSIVPGLFNFSTAATTCDQDFMRLVDVLDENRGRFSHVLLDVSPLKLGYSIDTPVSELNSARVHALLYVYHHSDGGRPLGSVWALWRDVICVRKFNEFRKSLLRKRVWRSSMAGAFDPDKGRGFLDPRYVELALKDVAKKADRVNGRPPADVSLPIFGVLARSIELVRESGAVPVVTTMPLSRHLRNAIDTERMEAFRAVTASLADEMGVVWLDYLDLDLPDELWHDGNHLNKDGAKEFSVRFASDFGKLRSTHGEAAP